MDRRNDNRDREPSVESGKTEAKRRKIRKGSHSCYECKRRKIRCFYSSENDDSCVGCRRRGTACVSQEFENHQTTIVTDPIVRVEGLLHQLIQRLGGEASEVQPRNAVVAPAHSVVTPELTTASESGLFLDSGIISVSSALLTPEAVGQVHSQTPPITPAVSPKHAKLSAVLYGAFPPPGVIDILRRASRKIAVPLYLMNFKSQKDLERNGIDIGARLARPPAPDMHPVLLARQMLIFASLLQQLNAEHGDDDIEDAPGIMNRLASTAIDVLTTNEELLGTVEGLECIILQGLFRSNCGNLRQAWVAFRKALTFGQLMGIHRADDPPLPMVDPLTEIDRQFVWFRIVYNDRFLSTILGIPQGTTDMSMVSDRALANETPIGRLERIHARIAGLIIQRNERDPLCQDYNNTLEIDAELLKAATAFPSKFWLPPSFSDTKGDANHEFWETVRLMNHLVHYNLLSQLHLPYLLRTGSHHSYEYSRIACVNASREILTRFISYTNFKKFSYCCRRVDFFALLASMTLLLAHIHSHRQENNLLTHHRLNDHAMTCHVLENMVRIRNVNDDELSGKGTNLLRSLLTIESHAANGQGYTVRSIQGAEQLDEACHALRINIPYFGVIKISRDGAVSKEATRTAAHQEAYTMVPTQRCQSEDAGSVDFLMPSSQTARFMEQYLPAQQLQTESVYPSPVFGYSSQKEQFPSMTSGIDDWAFQGVDMAFFDSLMKGVDLQDEGSVRDLAIHLE